MHRHTGDGQHLKPPILLEAEAEELFSMHCSFALHTQRMMQGEGLKWLWGHPGHSSRALGIVLGDHCGAQPAPYPHTPSLSQEASVLKV